MYIGAFIDAIPIPNPPKILKKTSIETVSGNIDGSPEPQADNVNSTAEIIKEYFLPIFTLNGPATIAPTKHPSKALPTTQPFIASSNSKYLLKKNCAPLITPVS